MTKINGTVLNKLNTLDEVLLELRSLGRLTTAQLDHDWRTRRAVERDLQILVEIVIDVCQRIIAVEGQTPTTTGAEAIRRSVQLGVLSSAQPYQRMVQFRNFIVHRYEQVDVEILVDIVNRRLPSFEQFKQEVLAYVQR